MKSFGSEKFWQGKLLGLKLLLAKNLGFQKVCLRTVWGLQSFVCQKVGVSKVLEKKNLRSQSFVWQSFGVSKDCLRKVSGMFSLFCTCLLPSSLTFTGAMLSKENKVRVAGCCANCKQVARDTEKETENIGHRTERSYGSAHSSQLALVTETPKTFACAVLLEEPNP